MSESETESGRGRITAGARAAAWPLAGLVAVYVLAVLTPWGRRLDALSWHGRFGTRSPVRIADLVVLETISVASLVLALVTLVVMGGLRGRWRLGLRHTVAVIGSLLSAEILKMVLPGTHLWSGEWQEWPGGGSFPSGHSVVVTSVSLAVLSISTETWRRRLAGPLVFATAIATTATVTVGWHRPSDVIASLFLATAWHRAITAERPAAVRRRTRLPLPAEIPGAAWWIGASVLVLGAALEGVPGGLRDGYLAPLVYLCSLAAVLAGVLVTVAVRPVHPAR